MSLIFTAWIKFLVVFAPFFVVSMFISLTRDDTREQRNSTANRAIFAAFITSIVLFFFGTPLFEVLGITLDSFRIGAGALLFLSAVSLVRDGIRNHAAVPGAQREDIAVVPMAIPIIIGPASTGAIIVYGAELHGMELIWGLAGLSLALVCVWVCMRLASKLERLLGKVGLNILSKLTGMILAALAAQIVFTGIRGFLNL